MVKHYIHHHQYIGKIHINFTNFIFYPCLNHVESGSHCIKLNINLTAIDSNYHGNNASQPIRINPILTGGGGSIWPPPLYKIRNCLATAADRDAPFHEFFLSSLTHLLIPSLWKSDHRTRGHGTFCTRTSAQNLLKIRISIIMFVYKTHGNYWFS